MPMTGNGMVRPCSRPTSSECCQGGTEDKEHATSGKLDTSPGVMGIDMGDLDARIEGLSGYIETPARWCRSRASRDKPN